jgi:hypothetical protein
MPQIYTDQEQYCFKKFKISVIFCRKWGFSELSGYIGTVQCLLNFNKINYTTY